MRRRASLAALFVIAVAWNAALFAAPVTAATRVSAATYLAGSMICHQRPERSFHRDGAQYPVCARCLGLYAGAAAGVLAWAAAAGLQRRPRARAARVMNSRNLRTILLVVATPTLVSVALAWAGWDSSNLSRAVLAFPLGGAIAAVIAAVAAGDLR